MQITKAYCAAQQEGVVFIEITGLYVAVAYGLSHVEGKRQGRYILFSGYCNII